MSLSLMSISFADSGRACLFATSRPQQVSFTRFYQCLIRCRCEAVPSNLA